MKSLNSLEQQNINREYPGIERENKKVKNSLEFKLAGLWKQLTQKELGVISSYIEDHKTLLSYEACCKDNWASTDMRWKSLFNKAVCRLTWSDCQSMKQTYKWNYILSYLLDNCFDFDVFDMQNDEGDLTDKDQLRPVLQQLKI